MKRIFSAVLLSWLALATFAQVSPDQRTTTTKIADLLARMPATNHDELLKNGQSVASLGEDGVAEMASMLLAPGTGDNTKLEYALSGFSYYTTQPGNDALRASAARSYVKALGKLSDPECKAFLIRQLQITASEEALPTLQTFLADERLADPAARALVKVHSPAAGQALTDALKKTSSSSIQATLLQALGDFKYPGALSSITAFATGTDAATAQAARYALAQIASPGSEPLLAAAAEKVHFRFDGSGATRNYIDYARQLLAHGKSAQAEKIAQDLLKKAVQPEQLAARTAGLKLLVDIQGEKSLPTLVQASSDKNPQYRQAALKYASGYISPADTKLWVNKLATLGNNPAVKGEIISMLGDSRQGSSLNAVSKAIQDADPAVRSRAVKAAGQIGQQEALPSMLALLKKTNSPSDVEAVSKALSVMKGDNVTGSIAQALPSMPSKSKAMLIDALAARGADQNIGDVLPLVESNDTLVRRAAFGALKSMSTRQTLPNLYGLLNTVTNPSEIRAVQDAAIAASSSIQDPELRTQGVLGEMKNAPSDKQSRYYDILAGIGSASGLQVVSSGFANGNAANKRAAVSALSSWPNAGAAEPLFQIAKNPANSAYFEDALQGYIHLTSHSGYPADQRLLMLRKAMEIAQTTAEKQGILREVKNCKTFIALVFAGQYLDDADLQQPASEAVMAIALADKSYKGPVVRSLLEKTILVLKGTDSDYEKQGIRKYLAEMPSGEGIVPMFNGKDLSGWKGLVENPIKRAQMDSATLAAAQQKADERMRQSWSVRNGILEFSGNGDNLCTVKKYADIDMYVDWRIDPDGDAGIYLRGSPQVQIWDTARKDVGAQVGSGGLYNNQVYESKPLVLADNAIGDWNSFHIIMVGDRVTVYLNGKLVVDHVILENYWDRSLPIFPEEQIELQAHGRHVSYRDLYIQELPRVTPYVLSAEEKKDGFELLFDGTNMHQWTGNTTEYVIEDGDMVVRPIGGNHGNLYTKKEYQDFVYRFEFQLTPGANNGIGIRAPLEGDAAYVGMEIQVLDNEAEIYRNLHEYQYHGSVYGVIPAKRGFLKPLGEWNVEEITAIGNHIKVILNGTVILDGDISDAIKNGTLDKRDHPGLKNVKGHLGFLGHGDVVKFRHMRVKDLSPAPAVPQETGKKKKNK